MGDILELKDLRFDDLNQQPADQTRYITGDERISPNINMDVYLTQGRYRLTFSKPIKTIALDQPIQDDIRWVDTAGVMQVKRYTIDKIAIDFTADKSIVDITIIDNPVWLPLLWAAVYATIIIVGAVAVDTVLERVETIISKPSTVALGFGIILILLLPSVITLLGKK